MVHPRSSFAPPKARYLRNAFHGRHISLSPRLRWGLLAVLLALYVVHFVGGDHGILRRMELRKDIEGVAGANVKLRLQKEQLLHEVQLKENDPLSLERLAREKYWMIGPGETVYRFKEDDVVPDVTLPDEGGEKVGPK